MPRLVRRAPLMERIKGYLDPWDWLMWAQEELNSGDWEDFAKSYATSLGVAMNVLFVIAKANADFSVRDDVFLEGDKKARNSGWLTWFLGLIVSILTGLSFLNAFYTFYRKRHYRLFEQPIETGPSTPSAHRVRVDSSPIAASPIRFLQNMIGSESAASRAHPDAARDVWEIAVWDPNPLCLQLFCLFSPLHVILYSLNFPVAPLENRPSVKFVTTLALAAMLSAQFCFLRTSFSQQIKDSAVIHREVMNEYDTKYVHPNLQRPYRDVGIQTITTKKRYQDSATGPSSDLASEVDTYTPTTIIKRGFRTHPNEVYAPQYDPDNLASQPVPRATRSNNQTPSIRPQPAARYAAASTADFSPIRQSNSPNPFRERSQMRASHVGSGDGGSLGVYSHAASPLRKSASANYLRDERSRDSGSTGERRAISPSKREGSPLKRMSTPSGFTDAEARTSAMSNPFQTKGYTGLGVGRRESGRL